MATPLTPKTMGDINMSRISPTVSVCCSGVKPGATT